MHRAILRLQPARSGALVLPTSVLQNPRPMPGSSLHFACSCVIARVYSRQGRNLDSCICGAFEAVM